MARNIRKRGSPEQKQNPEQNQGRIEALLDSLSSPWIWNPEYVQSYGLPVLGDTALTPDARKEKLRGMLLNISVNFSDILEQAREVEKNDVERWLEELAVLLGVFRSSDRAAAGDAADLGEEDKTTEAVSRPAVPLPPPRKPVRLRGNAAPATTQKTEPSAEPQAEKSPENAKERLDRLFAALSKKDLWRSDAEVGQDRVRLYDMPSDALRSIYLRRKFSLDPTDADILANINRQIKSSDVDLQKEIDFLVNLPSEQQRELIFVTREEEEGLLEYYQILLHSSRDHVVAWKEYREKQGGRISKPVPAAVEIPPENKSPEEADDFEVGDPDEDEEQPPRAEPAEDAPEAKSFFARAREWAKWGEERLNTWDVYRTHIRGELTDAERSEQALTLSKNAIAASAVFSALMSYSGYRFPVDAVRYTTQRYFVGKEREEILAAFGRYNPTEMRAQESDEEHIKSRFESIERRIRESRYITGEQKQKIIDALYAEKQRFQNRSQPIQQRFDSEVARILEDAIRTRVTGMQVLQEATNTALKMTGFWVLRAPTYATISLVKRWQAVTHRSPESSDFETVRMVVVDGFDAWWKKAKGNEGRLAQAAAIGSAARFVGVSVAFAEDLASSEIIQDLLERWQSREVAYPEDALDFKGEIYDSAPVEPVAPEEPLPAEVPVEPATEQAAEVVRPPEPVVPRALPAEPASGVSSETSSLVPDVVSVSDAPGVVPDVAEEPIDEPEDAAAASQEREIVTNAEDIPQADDEILRKDSLTGKPLAEVIENVQQTTVQAGDGITQALLRTVEAHPDLLPQNMRNMLKDDYMAKLLMRRIAAQEDLLGVWIDEEAVGKLVILPHVDEGGHVHVLFADPITGKEFTRDELEDKGWLTPVPR